MNAPLQPNQLPTTNAQFIAYGAPERVADPMGGDDPITVRPEVLVHFYNGAQIAEIKEGGRTGKGDVVRIELDPESLGLKDPVASILDPKDPLVAYLTEKHEKGQSFSIGIEVQRRAKHAETRERISPLPPIQALRGATTPTGKGDMAAAKNTVSSKIALVDGRPSTLIKSDPTEWASLAGNHAGDLPPEGWRRYAPGDDWTQICAIVPKDGSIPRPGGTPQAAAVAPEGLAEMLRTVVTEAVQAAMDARDASAGPQGRPSGRGFAEGKPWDVRTNDGRMNLGHYAVTDQRRAYAWAHDHLATLRATDEDPAGAVPTEDAWNLAGFSLAMADRVQSNAYAAMINGGKSHARVSPDRAAASHREARAWVEWVISHSTPYPDGGDADALSAWGKEVITQATDLLATAGSRNGEFYAQRSKDAKSSSQPQSGGGQDATAQQQDEQAAATPTGQGETPADEAMIASLLEHVQQGWSDRQRLGALGSQVKARGLAALQVSMGADEQGQVRLSHPPRDGEPSGDIEGLLRKRWTDLGADDQEQGQATKPDQPAQQERGTQTPAQDDPREAAADIAWRAAQASDMNSLKALYNEGSEANVLQTSIAVAYAEDGTFSIGTPGQEGHSKQTLSQVLNARRSALTGGNGEQPAETTAQTPAPQSAGQEDAAAEQGDDPSVAQQIAEDAAQATDGATIQSLIEKAQSAGVLETQVSVGGKSGVLRALLNHRRSIAEEQS